MNFIKIRYIHYISFLLLISCFKKTEDQIIQATKDDKKPFKEKPSYRGKLRLKEYEGLIISNKFLNKILQLETHLSLFSIEHYEFSTLCSILKNSKAPTKVNTILNEILLLKRIRKELEGLEEFIQKKESTTYLFTINSSSHNHGFSLYNSFLNAYSFITVYNNMVPSDFNLIINDPDFFLVMEKIFDFFLNLISDFSKKNYLELIANLEELKIGKSNSIIRFINIPLTKDPLFRYDYLRSSKNSCFFTYLEENESLKELVRYYKYFYTFFKLQLEVLKGKSPEEKMDIFFNKTLRTPPIEINNTTDEDTMREIAAKEINDIIAKASESKKILISNRKRTEVIIQKRTLDLINQCLDNLEYELHRLIIVLTNCMKNPEKPGELAPFMKDHFSRKNLLIVK